MNELQLEAWALRVVDAIRTSVQPEGAWRVECKVSWPEPEGVARQLGGHANAARGEQIIWLIGVDEQKGPVACAPRDLAEWWPAVQGRFDDIPPQLAMHQTVFSEGVPFQALLFDTRRFPYVLKSTSPDDDRLEVPWRDGTRTRSARREELVRVLDLVPIEPTCEILGARIILRDSPPQDPSPRWSWESWARIYVGVPISSEVALPDHLVRATFRIPEAGIDVPIPNPVLRPGAPASDPEVLSGIYGTSQPRSVRHTVHASSGQTLVEGPGGVVTLRGGTSTPRFGPVLPVVQPAFLELVCGQVGAGGDVEVVATLASATRETDGTLVAWETNR